MAKPTAPIIAADAPDAVERAAAVLLADGLAALPTETVYGLAARAQSPAAVAGVYAAKGRPSTNPLIVHGSGAAMLAETGEFTDAARALAAAFWPGPLTLVVTRRSDAQIADAACAGGPTVALRAPDAPLLAAVAARIGPLVAPSANRSGEVSATTAGAVAEGLGNAIDLIVDGGPSPIGVESTVLDVTGPPRLLRPGALEAAAIEAVVGPLAIGPAPGAGPLRSPGLLSSHYAPRARVRLDVAAGDVAPHEAWLALGDEESAAAHTVRLSLSGDLHEAARNLYTAMRAADATGAAVIAVSPIPDRGIGSAIRDRLRRAAAPRDA